MKNDNLVHVYSGSEIEVNLLKEKLTEKDIASLIRNDNKSGIMAGFYGGGPEAVHLFILEADLKKAEKIIKEFADQNG
jgi:hypothetical protein